MLVGKWHKPWPDGVMPTDWDGSGEIIHKYFFSGRKPVKYSECWIYAMILCTVGRALGVPARITTGTSISVPTNSGIARMEVMEVLSLHDLDREAPRLESNHAKSDQVWGWHVWTEFWMQAPAKNTQVLQHPEWQIADATPQFPGKQGLGPASRSEVKDLGQIFLAGMLQDCKRKVVEFLHNTTYCPIFDNSIKDLARSKDAHIFTAQQHAANLQMVMTPHGDLQMSHSYHSFGKGFYTQRVGDLRGQLMDVSCEFDYGCHQGTKDKSGLPNQKVTPNFLYEIKVPPLTVPAGQDFNLELSVTARANDPKQCIKKPRELLVYLQGHIAHRWHKVGNTQFFTAVKSIRLTPESCTQSTQFRIPASSFMDLLAENSARQLRFSLMATPSDRKRGEMHDVFMVSPMIATIQIPRLLFSDMRIGNKAVRGKLAWKNPMNKPLKKCCLAMRLIGPSHSASKRHIIREIDILKPHSSLDYPFTVAFMSVPPNAVQAKLLCSNFVAAHGYFDGFNTVSKIDLKDRFIETSESAEFALHSNGVEMIDHGDTIIPEGAVVNSGEDKDF